MKKTPHKIGFGFDSHSFSQKGILVLGGQKWKGYPALKGHSDGDAIVHAVIDALLGGAGLGDIGDYFPDSSSKWKGISSLVLLKKILKKIKEAGWIPHHIDITVVCEKPRFSYKKKVMSHRLARTLGLSPLSFNIKAKTPEGLCLFQNGEGIAVWAVATLTSIK